MSKPNVYQKGQTVRCRVEVTIGGVLTDPADGALTFKGEGPDAASVGPFVKGTNAELVRDSAGKFHVDVLVAKSGRWSFAWIGTGATSGAREWILDVEQTRLT